MSDKQKVELGYWAVAFVDLLGQGDQMRSVSNLLEQGEEEQAIAGMKEIYFAHKDLYESFEENYESFSSKELSISLPPNINKADIQYLKRNQMQMQRFSDALMFFVPLREDEQNLPLYGISSMLSSVGILLPIFLAKERPFRCGVDIGFGIEIKQGELCGPAIMHAHELESKIAQYPRIVIGESLLRYLQDSVNVPSAESTPDQRATSTLAKRLLTQFIKDTDGQIILHYLGKEFLSSLPSHSTTHVMQAAFGFAMGEQQKHRGLKNTKLAFRYTHLCNYFAAHEENWRASNESPAE